MNQILNKKYEDQYVRKTFVYRDPSVSTAYYDPELLKPISTDELQELFHKGCIIVMAGIEYNPTSFVIREDGYGIMDFIIPDEVDDTIARIEIVKSHIDDGGY